MEFGFMVGSKVLVGREQILPIQALRRGDDILGFVEGKLFPAKIAYCFQHFVDKMILIRTEAGSIKGGIGQTLYQYDDYVRLDALKKNAIVLRQTLEPERITETILCNISAPVYTMQTYPELPFIVNGFVVGNPHIGEDYVTKDEECIKRSRLEFHDYRSVMG